MKQQTRVARVRDVLDGVFVVKLCESEGPEPLVRHGVARLDVDGRLALAAAFWVRQLEPMRRLVLWRQRGEQRWEPNPAAAALIKRCVHTTGLLLVAPRMTCRMEAMIRQLANTAGRMWAEEYDSLDGDGVAGEANTRRPLRGRVGRYTLVKPVAMGNRWTYAKNVRHVSFTTFERQGLTLPFGTEHENYLREPTVWKCHKDLVLAPCLELLASSREEWRTEEK